MKKQLPLSQEILNAFVDNEIEDKERSRILEMESTNQELANEICELRRLKELVKSARPNNLGNEVHISIIKKRNNRVNYAVASVLIAFVISLSFVYMNNHPDNVYSTKLTYAAGSTYRTVDFLLAAANKNKSMNLVLHLKSLGSKQAIELLYVLESVVQTSARSSNNLHVEDVVSGPGIYILQKDVSVYANKISAIVNKHENVTFIACKTTLHRLQEKTNKNIQIIN